MSNQQLLPFALESILNDLNACLQSKLYYPALLVALTIPEVCITLAFDNYTMVKEKHYAAFVNKYTTEQNLGLDGSSCYWLRCGMVHRANAAANPKLECTHVIFTVPESRINIHAMSMVANGKTAAIFNLKDFCAAIENAARKWYTDNGHKPLVADNLKKLISNRQFGVPPFVVGAPVLASGP